MLNVTVIGSGNVAQHLIKAFLKADGVTVVQAFARTPENLRHILPADKIATSMNDLSEADVYIIAVTDNAIGEVAEHLTFKDKLVVHTSGSMPMQNLSVNNRRGVFYPLQTFSKNKEVDFDNVSFCIESEFEEDYMVIEHLAKLLSPKIYKVDSQQRNALHVAAVFASNFANHMYVLANEICHEHNLPFEILKPLITETAAKVQELSPVKAQTGPALRNDSKTIKAHLELLTDDNQKDIYKTLTQSIQAHAEKL